MLGLRRDKRGGCEEAQPPVRTVVRAALLCHEVLHGTHGGGCELGGDIPAQVGAGMAQPSHGRGQDASLSSKHALTVAEGVRIPFKHNRPPPNFHNGISMQDATPAQLTFLEGELARFVESGAWELGTCRKWVSRLFLVPKPGVNQWRCIIDLRVLNSYCVRKRLKMETLLGVRHLTKKGDYMFSFDLQDGFYALGIAEADRDYFTVDVRGQLYRLAGLPMGWSLSPYYFVTLTQALHLRQRLASLVDALGLQRNPTKGFWEPCQFGGHLEVDIDSASGMFYAPADKLNRLSRQATRVIGRATRNARWLPVRELQSLAGQAHYLFLAIPAARFFLRELHSVVGDRWGGRVRMTPQLRRDLQWWTSVPSQSNGKPIHRPVETAYLHTDSSGYGWGGVLNGRLEARGFWSSADERQHITWKELKAVRLAVESFLPHLAGRNVLLHEDNQAVCHILSGLTSRSPEMMAELRRLRCLLDLHGIHLCARYIRSAANIWADRLSRHLASDDWQLDPLMFAELESRFGPHSIDRFASALNTLLPRYTAAWLDPTCEAVDSLHLPDADWRRENNCCMKQYFRFCEEEKRPARATDPGTMARYVTWLGNLGTIKALQSYLSAVNSFFKDHGREPMALGDMVSRVRNGLAASQVTLNPELIRAPLPARVVLKALTLAKALRLELGPTWGTDPSTVVRVELFRASLAVVVLCLFFCRGGAGVECLTGDLTVGPDGGILLYHRDRKGQCGADASKKLLCQQPASAHADIAALLHNFDAARQVFAGGRVLAARWAIS
eukprot:jgi/Tetstr1/438626/TSEL_027177.t1